MKQPIDMAFGKIVASMRQSLRISQAELGFKCGLHRTYIGALERGEKSPTLGTILKLAKGLEVTPNKLIEPLCQLH